MFKFKEVVNKGAVVERLYTLKDKVTGIHRMGVGLNFMHVENSYDVIERYTFLTRDDFNAFRKDAYHASVRTYMQKTQFADKNRLRGGFSGNPN